MLSSILANGFLQYSVSAHVVRKQEITRPVDAINRTNDYKTNDYNKYTIEIKTLGKSVKGRLGLLCNTLCIIERICH